MFKRTSMFFAILGFSGVAFADIPRLADGTPDISGTYNSATLTPVQRPKKFGEKLYLAKEEADAIAEAERALMAKANAESDPNRLPPAVGGAAPKVSMILSAKISAPVTSAATTSSGSIVVTKRSSSTAGYARRFFMIHPTEDIRR